MEQQQKHFLKWQPQRTSKRKAKQLKSQSLENFRKQTGEKNYRKVQSLQRLLHNLFIKMLPLGRRHDCKTFQINHKCFPLEHLHVHIFYLSLSVAVGEFCRGLGFPDMPLLPSSFLHLCKSLSCPELNSRFPSGLYPSCQTTVPRAPSAPRSLMSLSPASFELKGSKELSWLCSFKRHSTLFFPFLFLVTVVIIPDFTLPSCRDADLNRWNFPCSELFLQNKSLVETTAKSPDGISDVWGALCHPHSLFP